MDLKRLSAMAKIQRAADNEKTQKIISGVENEITDVPVPIQQEEIFVPIEDDEPDRLPDDGYTSTYLMEDPHKDFPEKQSQPETLDCILEKCFTDEKAYNIELERLLPFRSTIFTNTGDLTDLKTDIARVGITEPLLVRSIGNGEYEILSGNRRRAAAEQLMWKKVPCRIGSNDLITDEYAKRIVVETNRHRFQSLSMSEQIRSAAVLGQSADRELHITHEQADIFRKLNVLEQDFLVMLDSGEINITTAEMLSEISADTQIIILNVLKQHPEMKITAANAKELHDEGNLTASLITKILKPKPPVKIAVPAELVSEYMNAKTPEELTEIATLALRRYFEEEQHGKI